MFSLFDESKEKVLKKKKKDSKDFGILKMKNPLKK